MEEFNTKNKEDTLKLGKYFKRCEKFYSEQKLLKLMNQILKGEKIPFALRSIDPTLLQLECSKFVLHRSLEENKASHKFKRFKLIGTISGIIIAGVFTFYVNQVRKDNQDKRSSSSVKMTEINDESFSQNNQDKYVLNSKQKQGQIKISNIISNLSSDLSSISFDHVGKDLTVSGSTIKYGVSDGAVVESISGSAILKNASGGVIIQNVSDAAISTNLDSIDEMLVYNNIKVNKGESLKEESNQVEEYIKEVHNTTELLALYNKNIKSKKLDEDDLKILSQFDQELISIKGKDGSYHQVASSNYVATTKDNDVHIIFSPNVLDRDYLTGKNLNKKVDIVDYTKVSKYIEDHGLKSVGYQFSSNSFWGYKTVSKINELYGSEIVSRIQKYGLPIPVYKASDFDKMNEKASGAKKIKK